MFYFNDTPTTEICTLSLHDALPISSRPSSNGLRWRSRKGTKLAPRKSGSRPPAPEYCTAAQSPTATLPLSSCSNTDTHSRSEEHTSELQSRRDLVCRLLLEKKKKRA